MSLALGGTPVQVPPDFLARAREILANYQAGVLEDELNEVIGLQREHCPRCGSINFRRTMQLRRRIYAIFIVLFMAAFPTKRSTFICNNCGHQWEWGEREG
jgi:hypothetical protein